MKKTKREKQVRVPRYFVGSSLQDLLFEITQLLTPDLFFDKNPHQVKIIPVHPKPYKMWWEFYVNDVKICTVCYEAQDEKYGTNNMCWLKWYNDFQGYCLRELYDREGLIPEWVETDEDEDEFFKAA